MNLMATTIGMIRADNNVNNDDAFIVIARAVRIVLFSAGITNSESNEYVDFYRRVREAVIGWE